MTKITVRVSTVRGVTVGASTLRAPSLALAALRGLRLNPTEARRELAKAALRALWERQP